MNDVKKQPASEESEIVVIGSCLLSSNGSVYDTVSQIVTSADFYYPVNQILFDAIGQLVASGQEVCEITLLEKIRKDGNETAVGGIAGIYGIQERVLTSAQATYAANEVKDKSKLRQLIRISGIAQESAYDMSDDADTISANLQESVLKMSDVKDDADSIAAAAGEVEADLKAMMDGTYEKIGLKFGIPSIDDKLLDGLVDGTVTVVAAPTSVGKSQAALTCALKNGVTNGLPVGYFSYEMRAKQLSRRIIQTTSGVSLARFRDQVANSTDQKRVKESIEKLKGCTIMTNCTHRSIDAVSSLARLWKRKHGIRLLVIDYLQLMDSQSNKMSSAEGIAHNSKRIKALALDLDIPVIVLSQVNREAVKRLAFNPESGLHVHDLIGSSSIEADSDNILLFWPSEGDPAKSRKLDVNGVEYMALSGQFGKYREGQRGVRFEMKLVEATGRFH